MKAAAAVRNWLATRHGLAAEAALVVALYAVYQTVRGLVAERQARLQVKSRWATDYDKGFPIKNFETDFVVHVALNRGYRYRRRQTTEDEGRRAPLVYVLPVKVVAAAQRPSRTWKKVRLYDIPKVESYLDN